MTREEIFLETESPILIKTRQHVRQGSRSTTSTGTRIFGETIEHIECFAAIRTIPTISQNNQLSPSRRSNCFFPLCKASETRCSSSTRRQFYFYTTLSSIQAVCGRAKHSKLLYRQFPVAVAHIPVFLDILKFRLLARNSKRIRTQGFLDR